MPTEPAEEDKISKSIQGISLRPPSVTLAHKEELNKMRMNEANREVHGFRCKLATCRCQELSGSRKQPGRRCMDEIERTERRAVHRQHHTN